MIITDIIKSPNTGRYNIYLDEEYSFSVEGITVVKENLKKGALLSDKKLLKIKEIDFIESIFQKCINLTSIRPRTSAEFKQYISKKLNKDLKQKEQEILEIVLEKLISYKLCDDYKFAQLFIEESLHKKEKSKLEIIQWLVKKGIEKELINKVVKEVDDKYESEVAIKLINKNKNRIMYKSKNQTEYKRKMSQFLLRKGFNWELIKDYFI